MSIVTLTWSDVSIACEEAVRRQTVNLNAGLKSKRGMSEGFFDGLRVHILGCLGEYAFAKGMNRAWTGQRVMHGADVADCIEVKSVDDPSYALIVRPDHDDQPEFSALAIVHSVNRVELAGWIRSKDGKQEKYWFEGNRGAPFYRVPRSDLSPVSDLVSILSSRDLGEAA